MKLLKSAIVIIILSYVIYLLQPTRYPIVNRIPSGKTIVALGDSLTFGTGAPKAQSYPKQLSQLIGEDVINLGIPGDTSANALARIKDVLIKNPRIVLLTIGGNDLKNGIKKEIVFDNIKNIVTTLQESGALVIIGGFDIPLFSRDFGSAYRDLAKETGSVLVPNVLEDIIGNRELMSDTIHPNSKGYQIMAERFHEVLKPFLLTIDFS